MSNLSRRLKYYLARLGAIMQLRYIAFALLIYGFLSYITPFNDDEFDASAWARPVSRERFDTCYRGGMAEDIQKRWLRRGMSIGEVERLLGKPDNRERAVEYRYTLGMCNSVIDYDVLHIYFDAQGQLLNTEILEH